MIVSVVIPTYGRGDKIDPTLVAMLESDTNGLDIIEIIVVDDGSPEPIATAVNGFSAPPGITLTCLRQKNAGPAAARNTGFRASRGEVVIFIDDDILCPPDLIRDHVEAHRIHPRSVICGRCPYVRSDRMSPFARYLDSLGHDLGKDSGENFLPTPIVASGQLSVERAMFDADQGVYRDDLATPAAEEYELSLRLRERGIPILIARKIVAIHNHAVDLESVCRQAYKHSMGCAEVALKYPRILDLLAVRDVIRVNQPIGRGDSLALRIKKLCRGMLSINPTRAVLFRVAKLLERSVPTEFLLALLYKALLSASMQRGVRDGLKAYAVR